MTYQNSSLRVYQFYLKLLIITLHKLYKITMFHNSIHIIVKWFSNKSTNLRLRINCYPFVLPSRAWLISLLLKVFNDFPLVRHLLIGSGPPRDVSWSISPINIIWSINKLGFIEDECGSNGYQGTIKSRRWGSQVLSWFINPSSSL